MRQQRTEGAVVQIDLNNGFFAYGRILPDAGFAFYDILTKEEIKDVSSIVKMPILFIVAVYNDAITKGRWRKIGKIPLESKFDILPKQFIQDALNPDKFQIYDNGEIVSATKAECIGLERAAVWEPEHVESRIRDYYSGEPNKWVKQMSLE